MKVFRGETKRLIINIPPRYSKTELAVINFMAWCFCKVPDSEFIHVSYSATLAANNAFQTRNLVQEDAYKKVFPDFKLRDDSKAKDDWRTAKGGVCYSQGTGGTITGFGAGKFRDTFGGAIIIDDPHVPVRPDLIRFVKVSLNGFKTHLNLVPIHQTHQSLSLCSDCMKKIWQGGCLMGVMVKNGSI